MNQKHKSARMYTHTHTHTIKFVCRLRTLCGRCAPWVSAFWRGIRSAAGRSGTGRTPGTEKRPRKSAWASHPNGYWCFWVAMTCMAASVLPMYTVALRFRATQSRPKIMAKWLRCLKSSTVDSKCTMALTIRRPICRKGLIATFTASNAAGKAAA